MSILAVTGLKREARIASGENVIVVSGGGDAQHLAREIEAGIGRGAKAILSFGIAGALSPALRSGDVVVATEVAMEKGTLAADKRWSDLLTLRLARATRERLLGRDTIVKDIAEKARLRSTLSAAAVDMESHIAARLAVAHGLPFAVVRAVADTAFDTLPPAALVAMNSGGGIAFGRIMRSLIGQPSQIPALMRTARDSETAFAALLRCRNLLGLGFACPYLA